jgi:hypothetical protein
MQQVAGRKSLFAVLFTIVSAFKTVNWVSRDTAGATASRWRRGNEWSAARESRSRVCNARDRCTQAVITPAVALLLRGPLTVTRWSQLQQALAEVAASGVYRDIHVPAGTLLSASEPVLLTKSHSGVRILGARAPHGMAWPSARIICEDGAQHAVRISGYAKPRCWVLMEEYTYYMLDLLSHFWPCTWWVTAGTEAQNAYAWHMPGA